MKGRLCEGEPTGGMCHTHATNAHRANCACRERKARLGFSSMDDTCHKIAGVQMGVEFADKEANLEKMEGFVRSTAAEGAILTVFPECAVTGYCFQSRDEAMEQAEPVPGPSTERLAALCHELSHYVVVGLIERDGEDIFNAAVLVGPAGVPGVYRKVHLPYLGLDRFATAGDRPFAIADAGPVKIGMNICYDCAFSEASRVLALEGAELIVLPTNWPPGAETTSEVIPRARALENHVYYLAVNRVGVERGFRFIGGSSLCDPSGNVLASAFHEKEAIFYGEIDPVFARKKKIIRVPGEHEIDRFADRRPEMYGAISGKAEGQAADR